MAKVYASVESRSLAASTLDYSVVHFSCHENPKPVSPSNWKEEDATSVLWPLAYHYKRHPVNYFLLAIFTVSLAFAVGLSGAFTSGKVILEAASLTLSTFWAARRGLVAEAIAAREGLIFASELGFTCIQIEGDSLSFIRMVKGEQVIHRDAGVLEEDVQTLACGFWLCEFSFIKRSGNSVAHCLDWRGYGCVGTSTWEAHPPLWLSTRLFKDGYAH